MKKPYEAPAVIRSIGPVDRPPPLTAAPDSREFLAQVARLASYAQQAYQAQETHGAQLLVLNATVEVERAKRHLAEVDASSTHEQLKMLARHVLAVVNNRDMNLTFNLDALGGAALMHLQDEEDDADRE